MEWHHSFGVISQPRIDQYSLHLSNAFVDMGFAWQNPDFARRQLEHSLFAIFCLELGFDNLDLLRGEV